MTERLNDEQLEEIEARVGFMEGIARDYGGVSVHNDIRTLLAEVRALMRELDAACQALADGSCPPHECPHDENHNVFNREGLCTQHWLDVIKIRAIKREAEGVEGK